MKIDKTDWLAACKIKARSSFEFMEPLPHLFQKELVDASNHVALDDILIQLHDPNNNVIELEDEFEEETKN